MTNQQMRKNNRQRQRRLRRITSLFLSFAILISTLAIAVPTFANETGDGIGSVDFYMRQYNNPYALDTNMESRTNNYGYYYDTESKSVVANPDEGYPKTNYAPSGHYHTGWGTSLDNGASISPVSFPYYTNGQDVSLYATYEPYLNISSSSELSDDKLQETITINLHENPNLPQSVKDELVVSTLELANKEGVISYNEVQSEDGSLTITLVVSKAFGTSKALYYYIGCDPVRYSYSIKTSDNLVYPPSALDWAFDKATEQIVVTYLNGNNSVPVGNVKAYTSSAGTFVDTGIELNFQKEGDSYVARFTPSEKYVSYSVTAQAAEDASVVTLSKPNSSFHTASNTYFFNIRNIDVYDKDAQFDDVNRIDLIFGTTTMEVLPKLPQTEAEFLALAGISEIPNGGEFKGWLYYDSNNKTYRDLNAHYNTTFQATTLVVPKISYPIHFDMNKNGVNDDGDVNIETGFLGMNTGVISAGSIPSGVEVWQGSDGNIYTLDDLSSMEVTSALTLTPFNAQEDTVFMEERKVFDNTALTVTMDEIIAKAKVLYGEDVTLELRNVDSEITVTGDSYSVTNVKWVNYANRNQEILLDSDIDSYDVNFNVIKNGEQITNEDGIPVVATVELKIYPRFVHLTAGSGFAVYGSSTLFTQMHYEGHGYWMNQASGHVVGFTSASISTWYSANNPLVNPETPFFELANYEVMDNFEANYDVYAHEEIRLLAENYLATGDGNQMYIDYSDKINMENYFVFVENTNQYSTRYVNNYEEVKTYDGQTETITAEEVMAELEKSDQMGIIRKSLSNMGIENQEFVVRFWDGESFSAETYTTTSADAGTYEVAYKVLAAVAGQPPLTTEEIAINDANGSYTATITINPVELTVVANDDSKFYGQEDAVNASFTGTNFTATGYEGVTITNGAVVNGDSFNFTVNRTGMGANNGINDDADTDYTGTLNITAAAMSSTNIKNYTINTVVGNFDIEELTWTDALNGVNFTDSKIFNNVALESYQAADIEALFPQGTVINFTGATPSLTNVGTEVFEFTATNPNYEGTANGTVTLTVNPRPITFNVGNTTIVEGTTITEDLIAAAVAGVTTSVNDGFDAVVGGINLASASLSVDTALYATEGTYENALGMTFLANGTSVTPANAEQNTVINGNYIITVNYGTLIVTPATGGTGVVTPPVTPPTTPDPVTPDPVDPVTPAVVPVPVTPLVPEIEVAPAVDIPEADVPFSPEAETPAVDIQDEEVPFASGAAWALVNLILTIATAILSVALLVGYFINKKKDEEDDERAARDEDEEEKQVKRKGLVRLASIIVAVAAVILFVLTEDMRLPMILVDRWTIWHIAIAVVQVVVAIVARKKVQDNDDDTQDGVTVQ